MTPARTRVLLLAVVVALLGAGALALTRTRTPPSGQRQTLLLLTSLPLLFGEDFSIQGAGSPALAALKEQYELVPISVTDPADLAKGNLLLMAHPGAQTPENLVALDDWVRRGGRVMLLADPMLEWPSARPLGDALRPAPMFMDTGLLHHWGLRLDAPGQRGPALRKLGGYEVVAASPGSLWGKCKIGADHFVAHCRVGNGRATIVADADLLDIEHVDGPTRHNLDAIVSELAKLAVN